MRYTRMDRGTTGASEDGPHRPLHFSTRVSTRELKHASGTNRVQVSTRGFTLSTQGMQGYNSRRTLSSLTVFGLFLLRCRLGVYGFGQRPLLLLQLLHSAPDTSGQQLRTRGGGGRGEGDKGGWDKPVNRSRTQQNYFEGCRRFTPTLSPSLRHIPSADRDRRQHLDCWAFFCSFNSDVHPTSPPTPPPPLPEKIKMTRKNRTIPGFLLLG